MQYTVIVKRKHCVGNSYGDSQDCGLARAIKEQLPHLKIEGVGGWYVQMNRGEDWTFPTGIRGWGLLPFRLLRYGLLRKRSVTFTNLSYVEKQDAVKEAEYIITNHKIAEHEIYS